MFQTLVRRIAVAPLLISLLLLGGCGTEPQDSLGNAYVAPATLNLRGQLLQKNSTVAVLKHGEVVSVVDVRRRFVKVRSASGVEGWVDSLDLLTPEQMQAIRKERKRALSLPSEGSASAYETLNIHIEPSRQSPAFAQIKEGGFVSVLAYRAAPRTRGPAKVPAFALERPQVAPHRAKKQRRSRNPKLPPKPAPPKPPPDWQQLSYGFESESANSPIKSASETKTESKTVQPEKPVVMEEWALVRTKSDQVGWVLARNLMMGIPDEVAQYAEGKRITAYFDLGSVNDEVKGVKHNWLWTTQRSTESFDFDSWRVFLWNRRHHRFETSYRQRDVEGYFPVHVDPPDSGVAGRTFSLIMRDDDGKLRRRTYLFDGVRVHLTGTEDYHPPQAVQAPKPLPPNSAGFASRLLHRGWLVRKWTALKRRILGGS